MASINVPRKTQWFIYMLIASASLLVLAGLFYSIHYSSANIINDEQRGIYFSSNHRVVFLSRSCVNVEWRVEEADSVYIQGQPVNLTGTRQICGETPRLDVQRGDDPLATIRLGRVVATHSVLRQLILVAALGLLMVDASIVRGWRPFQASRDYFDYPGSDSATLVGDLRRDYKIIVLLLGIALALHLVLWMGWPLDRGADTRGYISFYVNVFERSHPVDYNLVASRQPLAPLFHSLTLSGGGWVNAVAQTILAVTSVCMVYLIVKPWGRAAGVLAALLCLGHLPVQLSFHQVSSEGIFTWIFIAILLSLRYALQNLTIRAWAILGICIALFMLTRPAGLIILLVLASLVVTKLPYKRKLALGSAALLTTALLFAPWILYKGIRYDIWSFAHGPGTLLFLNAYDLRLIRPDNGPASEHLAALLDEHVVQDEVYRSKGTTVEDFFQPPPSNWIYLNDIIYTIDMYEGWYAGQQLMNDVGWEAVRADPKNYLKTNASAQGHLIFDSAENHLVRIPTPRELPPFPYGRPPLHSWYSTYPEHVTPPTPDEIMSVRQREEELIAPLEQANGNQRIAQYIWKTWRRIWPSMILIYAFGFISVLANKRTSLVFLVMSILGASALFLISGLASPEIRYRLPMEPLFLIAASIGLKVSFDHLFRWGKRQFHRYSAARMRSAPETE